MTTEDEGTIRVWTVHVELDVHIRKSHREGATAVKYTPLCVMSRFTANRRSGSGGNLIERALEKGAGAISRYPFLFTAMAVFGSSYVIYKTINYIQEAQQDVTVSAPGKALIAGGYLVLEYPNVGLVVSCSSRFYTTVRVLKQNHSSEANSVPSTLQIQHAKADACLLVLVLSPQFHTHFLYSFNCKTGALSLAPAEEDSAGDGRNSNEFVEKCLLLVFSFLRKALPSFKETIGKYAAAGSTLAIKLRADNDFYSQVRELRAQQLPLISSSLSLLPKFLPCPNDPVTGELFVAKTGMGSSAALTTSLVGGLLKFFGCVRLNGPTCPRHTEDRRIVHNLAQLAHAVAQGKIGSGFDVSAAVFGSQVYKRFDPRGFETCMEAANGSSVNDNVIFAAVTDQTLWAQGTVQTVALPHGLDIVMGDVCGGSSSTSMARAVLEWKKEKSELSVKVWNSLAEANLAVQEQFSLLRSCELNYSADFRAVMKHASARSADSWNGNNEISTEGQRRTLALFLETKRLFSKIRGLLKLMGTSAGVEIEPDEQSRLCDATEKLPGVLCAGVPGAGGVDAVFAIVLSPVARMAVERLWSKWHTQEDRPLPLTIAAHAAAQNTTVCPLLLHAEIDPRVSGVRTEMMSF